MAFRQFYAGADDGRELAIGLERARQLRENADYLAEFTVESPLAVLMVARRFIAFVGSRIGPEPSTSFHH